MAELLTREALEQPINDAMAGIESKYCIEARAIAPIIVRIALVAQAEALEWVIEGTQHEDGPPPCRGYCQRCDLEREAARLRKEAE